MLLDLKINVMTSNEFELAERMVNRWSDLRTTAPVHFICTSVATFLDSQTNVTRKQYVTNIA